MRFDTVIFDLDGTITESGIGIINSAKYALVELGFQIPSHEILESFVGPPLYDSFTLSCGLNDEAANKAVALYRQRHNAIGWKEAKVYPGMHELLWSLKANGINVALASSKTKELCERTLDYFGLLPFFDRICAPSEKNARVSKAELITEAANGSSNSCMVGDRRFDMEGAVKAGVYPIGVLYGYGDESELIGSGAKELCQDVSVLRYLLLGNTPKRKGVFITLEGSDGCGKSTQGKLLKDHLESCGLEVVLTREPGGCPISERIREVLLDVKSMGMTDECEALLFAAARKQHINDTILPALKEGKIVICDRFVDSSIAYQGAGRGLGEWVWRINEQVVKDCMPEMTLVFDISPEEALKRRYKASEADRIELSKEDFQIKVYEAFMQMCESGDKRFYKIDAGGTIEQIEELVRQKVNEKLSKLPEGDKK